MCRSIKTPANFEPPATDKEIRAAAVQFVHKLSGTTRPARANEATFDRAVDEVTAARERECTSGNEKSPVHASFNPTVRAGGGQAVVGGQRAGHAQKRVTASRTTSIACSAATRPCARSVLRTSHYRTCAGADQAPGIGVVPGKQPSGARVAAPARADPQQEV
jgi:hypothetical protein